jgi:anti-sigma-K factor RskA
VDSRTVQICWLAEILVWVLTCSIVWFAATRDDYAKMNAAAACFSAEPRTHVDVLRCADAKRSDVAVFKAKIDRKARLSRVAAALGSAAALALWFLFGRPGLSAGPPR